MTFPLQQSGSSHSRPAFHPGMFDLREQLDPRRLTLAMWDQAFLMRHIPGGIFRRLRPRAGRDDRARLQHPAPGPPAPATRPGPPGAGLPLGRPANAHTCHGAGTQAGQGPLGAWLH